MQFAQQYGSRYGSRTSITDDRAHADQEVRRDRPARRPAAGSGRPAAASTRWTSTGNTKLAASIPRVRATVRPTRPPLPHRGKPDQAGDDRQRAEARPAPCGTVDAPGASNASPASPKHHASATEWPAYVVTTQSGGPSPTPRQRRRARRRRPGAARPVVPAAGATRSPPDCRALATLGGSVPAAGSRRSARMCDDGLVLMFEAQRRPREWDDDSTTIHPSPGGHRDHRRTAADELCGRSTAGGDNKAGGDDDPVVLTMADATAGLYYNAAVQYFVDQVEELLGRRVADRRPKRVGRLRARCRAADRPRRRRWRGRPGVGVDPRLRQPRRRRLPGVERPDADRQLPAAAGRDRQRHSRRDARPRWTRSGVTGIAVLADGLHKPVAVDHPLLSPADYDGITFTSRRSTTHADAIVALGANYRSGGRHGARPPGCERRDRRLRDAPARLHRSESSSTCRRT